MIILNEKEYAEECLKNRIVNNKPFVTLSILAKYYYHCLGYKKKKIMQLLMEYMDKYYPYYSSNKLSWDDSIEKIAANAKKFTLFEIDGVWITKSELETIKKTHNKVLERLAFTMLCIAKLNNIKNPKNNGWVNTSAKEIFNIARISCSVTNRYERLNMLNQVGLLEFPKKNDNLSSRVTFIDNESEKILFISDFRELGYEYLKFNGGNFIRCQDCGILIRNNKARTKKYCSACSGYTPLETKFVTCIDCGHEFEVDARLSNKCRCEHCQETKVREDTRKRVQKYREKKQM